MEPIQDAYGEQLLAQFNGQTPTAEFIERDDNYLDTGSVAGMYFSEYEAWPEPERRAIGFARGRVLDVGCGAGRHSLHLQQKGLDVTGIDNSPGAIKVCRSRGLKKALVRPVTEIEAFAPDSFETILMLGNNFGLMGDAENARLLLEKFARISSAEAQIIAGTLNPYDTTLPEHLEYLEFNRRRGRMPGQIRMRARYGKIVGEWFDYLFVSPEEMREIVDGSDWQIKEFIQTGKPNYYAVIERK